MSLLTGYKIPSNCKLLHQADGVTISWNEPPNCFLIIPKFHDDTSMEGVKELLKLFLLKWNLNVMLEAETLSKLNEDEQFALIAQQHSNLLPVISDEQSSRTTKDHGFIRTFKPELSKDVHLVICLGGDGTLLRMASMFQGVAPPVLAFHFGTLGFLTPFPRTSFQSSINHTLHGNAYCTLRSRLHGEIIRRNAGSKEGDGTPDSVIKNPVTEYHALNELVIDRGLSSSPCDLVVKANGCVVTHIQGDGLIICTPTGSTAYSMTTGASLIHPHVPAFLLTPINSLSLSSRAIVLPASLKLEISISPTARCKKAHFSFDGILQTSDMLYEGDSILIQHSPFPIPCIVGNNPAVSWFCDLSTRLNWNLRSGHPLTENGCCFLGQE